MKMVLRTMRVWSLFAAVAFSAALCFGQGKDSPSGTVTGHVYCADTNTAARFASVMLQPIEVVKKGASKEANKAGTGEAGSVKATVEYQIPEKYEMTVVQTEPGIKSATASSVTKPATTETGLVVQVPPFINEGEKIRVDTAEGAYMSRA